MAAAFFCISLFAYDAVRADVEECWNCMLSPSPTCVLVDIAGYTGCGSSSGTSCATFGDPCGSSPCENPMDPCEG